LVRIVVVAAAVMRRKKTGILGICDCEGRILAEFVTLVQDLGVRSKQEK
jgi:hypothetical protein